MSTAIKKPNSERVLTTVNSLSTKVLKSLVDNKTQIVRIKNYIDRNACKSISMSLRKQGYNDYLNAPSVGRIGMSYFETGMKEDVINHYFDTAQKNINILRNSCYPFPYPIDIFRCMVDEQWSKGCTLQTLYNKKMFVGLSRCMKPGIPLLARHAPNTPEADSLISQFGVNVYVDVPETGGDFAMWLDEISDREFLERRGSKYGMSIEPLGEPDFSIKPENGDLILFNARKLHAVLPGEGSDRLTISAFLGYRGDDLPLTIWS